MRRINLDELRFWLASNGPLAKEDLASRSRIKFYTVGRIIDGKREPTELEQKALCEATGIEKDRLFPVVENKKESA